MSSTPRTRPIAGAQIGAGGVCACACGRKGGRDIELRAFGEGMQAAVNPDLG